MMSRWRPLSNAQRTADKQQSIDWAQKILARPFVVLDVETTGFTRVDEIVQLTIINQDREPLLNTYVRPLVPDRLTMPGKNGRSAGDVTGITAEMIADAPGFKDIHEQAYSVLDGAMVVSYNKAFDRRMFEQDCERHDLPIPVCKWTCAMLAYAQFVGQWNGHFGSYTWQKLPVDPEKYQAHDALGDVLATHDLLHEMAAEVKVIHE